MDDDFKKAATRILLEELMEDDESVMKSGVVNMMNTLTAVAGAALALSEGHDHWHREEVQATARGGYTKSLPCPALPCPKTVALEYTTSEFRQVSEGNGHWHGEEAQEEGDYANSVPCPALPILKTVAPEYTASEFRAFFRMRRTTFQILMEELHKQGAFAGSRRISHENKLLSTLYLLGNLESYRSIGARFNMSKASLHYTVIDTCYSIIELHKLYIKFPTEQALLPVAKGFNKFGFPGVVGCLGVSHIEIPGLTEHRQAYVNVNGKPSIQLQAIADSNLLFTDIYTGWPGSVCKTRVLRNSPVGKFHAAGNLPAEFHLLGSSGYNLTKSCMVPYQKCGKLTQTQENYNKIHESAHLCIKRAFSLLKGKFCRLQSLEMRILDAIPVVIAAACVLHNFILTVEGINEEDMNDNEGNYDSDCEIDTMEWEVSARQKRDNIATNL